MNRRDLLCSVAAVAIATPLLGAIKSPREQWIEEFSVEFRKEVDPRSASSQQIADWIRCEAESHFDCLERAIDCDPAEEARGVADAIRDLS